MNVRMERVNSEIQKHLSICIQRRVEESFKGVLASVIRAETTKDLKNCNAYVSIFPSAQKKAVFDFINQNAAAFRKELATELSHLRCVPDVRYILDDGQDYSAKINSILEELKK